MSNPRIYVACLASYNNGKLYGRWIDATLGVDHIKGEIAKMLSESPEPDAEEWAIHDTDDFCGANIGEFEDLERVAAFAELIEKHGELGVALHNHLDISQAPAETMEYLEENYQGAHRTIEDWAESYLEDCGMLSELPEWARPYLDVAAWARDAELGGDIFTITIDGETHVFSNR